MTDHIQLPNNVTLHRWRLNPAPWPLNGNKLAKMQPIIRAMREGGFDGIQIVGGGRSNMLAAAAAMGQRDGFRVKILTRQTRDAGFHERLSAWGAKVETVEEASFQNRGTKAFATYHQSTEPSLLYVAEGGANFNAFNDMKAAMATIPRDYDAFSIPVGTGATYAALRSLIPPHIPVLGLSSFSNNTTQTALATAMLIPGQAKGIRIFKPKSMGKFGKLSKEQRAVGERLEQAYGWALDPIYNLKTAWAVTEMAKQGALDDQVLHIDTGGRLALHQI